MFLQIPRRLTRTQWKGAIASYKQKFMDSYYQKLNNWLRQFRLRNPNGGK